MFMLLVPVPNGGRPLSHPAVVALLDRARHRGSPLRVEEQDVDASTDRGRLMARLVFRDERDVEPAA